MPLGLGISCNDCFFFNIFSEDLYFNALIIGLFYICLVTDQILGEDGGGGLNSSNGGQATTKEGDHFLWMIKPFVESIKHDENITLFA